MTNSYRELTEVPLYEVPQYDDPKVATPANAAPGKVLWGGKHEPPAIGSKVRVTMNGLGRGTVRGYFVECDWLGLLVELHNPPQWWAKQNPQRPLAHIFGIEFALAQAA